jgi:hypothetical protein
MFNRIDRFLTYLQYDFEPRTRFTQAVFGWTVLFGLIILGVCLAGACIVKLAEVGP